MILLRLAIVENKQDIRKMPASGHDDCNSSSKGRLPRIVILASTLLHLGFPATPHGNGAANALARAEDRRRLRSSQNVLQRSVEPAATNGSWRAYALPHNQFRRPSFDQFIGRDEN